MFLQKLRDLIKNIDWAITMTVEQPRFYRIKCVVLTFYMLILHSLILIIRERGTM